MDQAIQVCGSILILVAFVGAQRGRLETDSRPYGWLNLIGAGVLAVLAAKERQPGFFLLEGVWALIAAHSLLPMHLFRAVHGKGASGRSRRRA